MIVLTSFKKRHRGMPALSVARWQPKGFNLPEIKFLAPIDRFGEKIQGYSDHYEYRKLYKANLLDRKEAILAWLDSLKRTKDIALCCWCTIEQQNIKGYDSIMCHTILLGNSIAKHRPDIKVFLDWDRFRYSIWRHNLSVFDPDKFHRKSRSMI